MKKHLKLFKKDFLLQKKTLPLTMILVLGLLFLNQTPNIEGLLVNFNFVTAIFIVATMIVTTSLVHDDKNNVLMVVNSLPVKRNMFVINKYLFANVVTILCCLVYVGLFYLIGEVVGSSKFSSHVYFSDFFISIAMVNIYFMSVFPLFFKFGYAKTQMFNMLVLMVLMGLSVLLTAKLPTPSGGAMQVDKVVSGVIPGIVSMVLSYILYYLSYLVSVAFYKKREF